MTRALTMTLAGLALLGLGAGAMLLQYGPPSLAWAQQPAAVPAAAPATVVEAVPVTVGRVTDQVEAVGTVQSNESVVVRPEISGRIARLTIVEGAPVAAGQPLLQLDDRILRGELAQAEASLRLAEKNFERADTLAGQGTGTGRSKDEALATLQLARASADLARARLEKATITAPFAGILGFRDVSLGDYITPTSALVNLESIDPVKLDFRVSEIYLAAIRVGQPVSIRVDALPDRRFGGEIYAINPLIDVNGRALRLRARIPNPDGALRPGLFARVTLDIATRENAVQVPEAALVAQGQDQFVFRVENARALRTKVEIGQRKRGIAEIRSGLSPDAVVVVAGQAKLREGAAVEVVKPGAGT